MKELTDLIFFTCSSSSQPNNSYFISRFWAPSSQTHSCICFGYLLTITAKWIENRRVDQPFQPFTHLLIDSLKYSLINFLLLFDFIILIGFFVLVLLVHDVRLVVRFVVRVPHIVLGLGLVLSFIRFVQVFGLLLEFVDAVPQLARINLLLMLFLLDDALDLFFVHFLFLFPLFVQFVHNQLLQLRCYSASAHRYIDF